VAPMKLSTLFDRLEDMYPTIKQKVLHSCALTVNLEYVDVQADADMLVNEGDEVAVIPPVSSG
jgi:molybdopterin converting factor small subunit